MRLVHSERPRRVRAGSPPAYAPDGPAADGRAARAWPVVAVLAAVAIGVQLWGLYRPEVPAGADWFPGADKVQHAVAFALPVGLVPLADTLRRRAAGRPPRARVLVLVVWVFAVHAVVSELVQHVAYAHRTGDPRDVLADWSGIVVGATLVGVGLVLGQPGRRGRAAGRDEREDDRG